MHRTGVYVDGLGGDRWEGTGPAPGKGPAPPRPAGTHRPRTRAGPARPVLAEAAVTDSSPAPRVTAAAGGRSRLSAEAPC